jgi:hypothetical protein
VALLPTISELSLVGVADRGVPNKERVVLRPTETVNAGEFALIAVWVSPEGHYLPIPDTFFWTGNIEIAPPSWLYVYTAPGTYSVSKIKKTNQPVHVCHWGRKQVLFHDERIQPALIRLGGIGFGGFGQTVAPMTEAEWSQLMRALTSPKESTMPTVTLPPSPSRNAPKGNPPRISDLIKKKP